VAVWSSSRGSESALLLAGHFPRLVHAVIALSPSSVVHPAINGSGRLANTSAWTLDGKQLAFSTDFNNPTPSGADARAIIPVERIRGPVLTASGGFDQLWDSSGFAAAIQRRLSRHHDAWPHPNYFYNAGHLIDIAIPNTAQLSMSPKPSASAPSPSTPAATQHPTATPAPSSGPAYSPSSADSRLRVPADPPPCCVVW
jgi:hypothetical protein